MAGLVLEGLALAGVPRRVRVEPGEQRAVVVPDPAVARRLADTAAGIAGGAGSGRVRLVPAEGGLLPYLTVLRNLEHGCRAGGSVTRPDARREAHEVAGHCGLGDVQDRYPHEITPGRRRLAGVARAMCGQPDAIVLEDARGLPTWSVLLDLPHLSEHLPRLLSAAVLLVAPDAARADGFALLGDGADEPGTRDG